MTEVTQRWGDAVVHSVAAGLFQSKDKIHFFKDIGYQHDNFAHCPEGANWSIGKCSCNPKANFGKRCSRFAFLHPAHLNLSCPTRVDTIR